MALPPRVYYTLQEVTARWGCNIADVAGWAAAGKFHIMTGIGLVRCGEEIVAGRVAISPMDLMPLFRRCGTGPTEGVVRRIMTGDKSQWQIITDPVGGVAVAVADIMVMADEVHAFEEENDIGKRWNLRFDRTSVSTALHSGPYEVWALPGFCSIQSRQDIQRLQIAASTVARKLFESAYRKIEAKHSRYEIVGASESGIPSQYFKEITNA